MKLILFFNLALLNQASANDCGTYEVYRPDIHVECVKEVSVCVSEERITLNNLQFSFQKCGLEYELGEYCKYMRPGTTVTLGSGGEDCEIASQLWIGGEFEQRNHAYCLYYPAPDSKPVRCKSTLKRN